MTPEPKKIKLSAPGGVAITWSDDHLSTYPYEFLRKRCPCATCRESAPTIVSADEPFPMLGKEPIRPLGAKPVGHYAISIRWNDGHDSGIYTYESLRDICPCPECSNPNRA